MNEKYRLDYKKCVTKIPELFSAPWWHAQGHSFVHLGIKCNLDLFTKDASGNSVSFFYLSCLSCTQSSLGLHFLNVHCPFVHVPTHIHITHEDDPFDRELN